jgi:spore protease
MKNLVEEMSRETRFGAFSDGLNALDEMEKYDLIREMLSPGLNTMFVTPKDIDETVKNLSFTISEGLNLAFSSI